MYIFGKSTVQILPNSPKIELSAVLTYGTDSYALLRQRPRLFPGRLLYNALIMCSLDSKAFFNESYR